MPMLLPKITSFLCLLRSFLRRIPSETFGLRCVCFIVNRLRCTDRWFNACILFSCLKERPKLISITRNDFRQPKTVLCVPRNNQKCWDCERIAFCWNKRLLVSKVSVSVNLCNLEVNCVSKTISNRQKDFDSGQTKKLGQAFPF